MVSHPQLARHCASVAATCNDRLQPSLFHSGCRFSSLSAPYATVDAVNPLLHDSATVVIEGSTRKPDYGICIKLKY
jgi:hypothetical protein